jgi:hypothetical protein
MFVKDWIENALCHYLVIDCLFVVDDTLPSMCLPSNLTSFCVICIFVNFFITDRRSRF